MDFRKKVQFETLFYFAQKKVSKNANSYTNSNCKKVLKIIYRKDSDVVVVNSKIVRCYLSLNLA